LLTQSPHVAASGTPNSEGAAAPLLGECDVPLSPIFVEFLARWLDGKGFPDEVWFDQQSEALCNRLQVAYQMAQARLERIATHNAACSAIMETYRFLRCLSIGNVAFLKDVHDRFDFIVVVGIARNGGSYLTGELYSALGYEPDSVPVAIAHDGVPEASPIELSKRRGNGWIRSLMSVSEYLTMLNLYFSDRQVGSRIIAPKKCTKGIYAPMLFKTLFGERAEYLITVRHPISSCVSTYEKSGGLPPDGRFRVRSAMEKWIKRDVTLTGVEPGELEEMDYFSAYVRYWEQYHIRLAMSGMVAKRRHHIVPYGQHSMEQAALRLHERVGSKRGVSRFVAVPGVHLRHPEWQARSLSAIERVSGVWSLFGLRFPIEEILPCS
jgi:hypothetical protein